MSEAIWCYPSPLKPLQPLLEIYSFVTNLLTHRSSVDCGHGGSFGKLGSWLPLLAQHLILLVKNEQINCMQCCVDTHLFGFQRGLVPYCFEFGNRWGMFFQVINRKKVAKDGRISKQSCIQVRSYCVINAVDDATINLLVPNFILVAGSVSPEGAVSGSLLGTWINSFGTKRPTLPYQSVLVMDSNQLISQLTMGLSESIKDQWKEIKICWKMYLMQVALFKSLLPVLVCHDHIWIILQVGWSCCYTMRSGFRLAQQHIVHWCGRRQRWVGYVW